MNKKFSTLLASFLLAGGLFSTADAAKIVDQVGEGYFYLEQVGEFTTSWAETSAKASDGQYWVICFFYKRRW